MVHEISGGRLKKYSNTSATQLNQKYVALYKIVINNCMPTKNVTLLTREQAEFIYKVGKGLPFNFASIVVNNIFRATAKGKDSHILPFPSLIHRLLKDQGYQNSKGDDVLEKEESLLSFEKTLFSIDKWIKDLPFRLTPLSREESDHSQGEEDDDKEDADVDPTTIPSISRSELFRFCP